MQRALSLALAVASAFGAAAAHADEGARPEARAIAEQGDAQFYAGRCDKAVPLWRKADGIYHAPTIVLRIARCQALLGQVVAAASSLSSMLDEQLPPDAPPAFVAAREDGEREFPHVRARIASIRVAVRPRAGAVPVTVEIDGAPAAEDGAVPVDPGTHHVRVRAGAETWERDVHLDDGEARTLDVSLWVEQLPAVPRAQRNTGLAVFGLGIAALATGVGVSVSALSTARALAPICGPDRMSCPPSAQAAIDRTRAYSLAADGVLTGGGVLVVAGAVLLTTDLHVGPESRIRLEASPRGVLLTATLGGRGSGQSAAPPGGAPNVSWGPPRPASSSPAPRGSWEL